MTFGIPPKKRRQPRGWGPTAVALTWTLAVYVPNDFDFWPTGVFVVCALAALLGLSTLRTGDWS